MFQSYHTSKQAETEKISPRLGEGLVGRSSRKQDCLSQKCGQWRQRRCRSQKTRQTKLDNTGPYAAKTTYSLVRLACPQCTCMPSDPTATIVTLFTLTTNVETASLCTHHELHLENTIETTVFHREAYMNCSREHGSSPVCGLSPLSLTALTSGLHSNVPATIAALLPAACQAQCQHTELFEAYSTIAVVVHGLR